MTPRTLGLFHRTSIARARVIMKYGFADEKWSFGLRDARTGQQLKAIGVWLTDQRPVEEEGPGGDAVLEVTMGIGEEALTPFELEGVLQDARLWIVPSHLVNAHASIRIDQVDPRTSWWYEAADDS